MDTATRTAICRQQDANAALARVVFVRRASATFAATRTLEARRVAPVRRPDGGR